MNLTHNAPHQLTRIAFLLVALFGSQCSKQIKRKIQGNIPNHNRRVGHRLAIWTAEIAKAMRADHLEVGHLEVGHLAAGHLAAQDQLIILISAGQSNMEGNLESDLVSKIFDQLKATSGNNLTSQINLILDDWYRNYSNGYATYA